jgi:S1-C subfamily serine protease
MKIQTSLSSVLCLALLASPAIASASAAPQTPDSRGKAAVGAHGKMVVKDRGYLGVYFENLSSRRRAELGIQSQGGAVIAAVDHDAPAGKAGLHRHDVVLKLNDKEVGSAKDFQQMLAKMSPGQAVVLDIVRNGQPKEIHAVLASRQVVERKAWSQHYTVPDPRVEATVKKRFTDSAPPEVGKTTIVDNNGTTGDNRSLPYTGVELETMSPQLAQYFGAKASGGLLARNIDPNSPGSRAGLMAGDVICKADGASVDSTASWHRILRENRNQPIRLSILRRRQSRTILLSLTN